MGGVFCIRVQVQSECGSNQHKIYSHRSEDKKKKVFAANCFDLCPEFRDKKRSSPQIGACFRPDFRFIGLTATFSFFVYMSRKLLVWGSLNLDGWTRNLRWGTLKLEEGMRLPCNLRTVCLSDWHRCPNSNAGF